jgi:hypothetical protein
VTNAAQASLVVAMPSLPGDEVPLAQLCWALTRTARQLAAGSEHDPGQAITTGDKSLPHQKARGYRGSQRKPK